MKPAPFIYERPATIEAALSFLADSQHETKILAGGQSLVPMMNFRMARPERLIDINGLANLDYIRQEGDELVIGGLARHTQVMHSPEVRACAPVITAAYEWVAHGPIRNRGTLAGNLCHADPASEMPALMLALNAIFVVRSATNERRIHADAFFQGIYETALEPSEMLMEIRIPVRADEKGWGFHEVSIRKGDFALGCVCALMTTALGVISTVAIGAAGIADRPLRLKHIETALAGQTLTSELFAETSKTAADGVDVIEDIRVSADYRRGLINALTHRALLDASKRAKG